MGLLEESVESAREAANRGDWSKALEIWDAAEQALPGEALTILGRGEALRELNRLDEAEPVILDAIAGFPDNLWARVNHVLIAIRHRDWDEALRRSIALRDRFPDAPQGYVVIGEALRGAGRP